jgi:8-oxo-dGTP diphosphatase
MIEVAAGLVFRKGQLLITQRRAADHLGGLWEFPGGKREPGESFPDCLARELREELDIEARVLECIFTTTYAYPEKTVLLQFHRCAWLRNEPRALGCQAFAWIGPAALGQYQFPPADARLLDLLQNSPAWWRPTGA